VYQSERYGTNASAFNYSIPVPNGSYNVSLDFAETILTGPGKRVFGASIGGTPVLTNFDIYAAAGGMNIAVVKTFTTTVSNGTLNIQFTPGSIDNPKVNGIEVVQSAPASPCDANGDGLTNVADVQLEVNMALSIAPCTNLSGVCTVVSVQRVANAALGGQCVAP
jgi:hypothetical protein